MAFLARMVSAAKWDVPMSGSVNEVSADALTSDLRTSNNSLSFWTVNDKDDEQCVRNAVLALASGRDRCDKMRLVLLDEVQFQKINVEIKQTEGITPAVKLAGLHRDVIELDSTKIVNLARLVAQEVRSSNLIQYSRNDIASLIKQGIIDGIVQKKSLSTRMLSQIGKAI